MVNNNITSVFNGIKRFVDVLIPVKACTLRCPYCYITHSRLFDSKVEPFKYSPQYVRRALSKQRLGGVSLINLCAAGETLLNKEVVELTRELLEEGHFVMVVTNATLTNRMEELASLPKSLQSRLFFKFSYHYSQLKKHNLLDKFFANVKRVRDAGASFTLEVTPYDDLENDIDDMNRRAVDEVGAMPHFTVARDMKYGGVPLLTNHSRSDYRAIWGRYDSQLFDFKLRIFEQPRREFCYAGEWSGLVDLNAGTWRLCYDWPEAPVNIFDDLSKPIPFKAVGHCCQSPHCWNGHVWLGLGDIPTMEAPTYAEMRNRQCSDGSEWLSTDVKKAFTIKLHENNPQYSFFGKMGIDVKNYYVISKFNARRLARKLLRK